MSLFKRKPKWYIKVNAQVLGPFTLKQLSCRHDINPFTLARKKGEKSWKMLAHFPECVSLFQVPARKEESKEAKELPREVLVMSRQRSHVFLWILLFLLIGIYIVLGIYGKRF